MELTLSLSSKGEWIYLQLHNKEEFCLPSTSESSCSLGDEAQRVAFDTAQ